MTSMTANNISFSELYQITNQPFKEDMAQGMAQRLDSITKEKIATFLEKTLSPQILTEVQCSIVASLLREHLFKEVKTL